MWNLKDVFDKYFSNVDENIKFPLMANCHKSVSLEKNRFYISPKFKSIHAERDDAKFIIFSAPGATGKSALAQHISDAYNCIYWDASQIAIGEKTLQGVLMGAVGDENYSEYKKYLQEGKTLLVIDALDEAEIISGRQNITFLLYDLLELKNGYNSLSFILLARTDTASYIYNVLKEKTDKLAYYEIEFFSIEKAKEFVQFKIKNDNRINDKKNISLKTVNDYIDNQFENISKLLSRDTVSSFLGYAPVLEIIAAAFSAESNIIKAINLLKNEKKPADGSDVIKNILFDLLDREHKKMVDALKEKWSTYDLINDWSQIYDTEEQLNLALSYFIFGEIDKDCIKNEIIKNNLIAEYAEVINTFLPQHPFVREFTRNDNAYVDFAGAAFRDYAIAYLQGINKSNEYIYSYFDEKKQEVSTLYYDFVKKADISELDGTIFSRMYNSFISKNSSENITYIDIVQDEVNNCLDVYFKYSHKDKIIQDWFTKILDKDKELSFSRLYNTFIDVRGTVVLECGKSSRIVDSIVICQNLHVKSDELFIESSNDNNTYIQCSDNIIIDNNGKNISLFTKGKNNIKVYASNIKQLYKLRPYICNILNEDEIDKDHIGAAISNILKYFRQHKKDAPAKDKEYIDNRVVGHSKLKKSILTFLLDKKIIYVDPSENHLYKLNYVNAKKYGIQWHVFGNISDMLYDELSKWLSID